MLYLLFVTVIINYIYEDADSLIVNNDSLVICGVHQYNIKVEISNHGKLIVRPWGVASDSLGKLELYAPLILLQDSSVILGSQAGYAGATSNSHPDGYGPGGGSAGGVSGGAGGGGAYGGAGGVGGDNYGGNGGTPYGSPSDTIIDIGSGGGAGRVSSLDGAGGAGGAKIYLKAVKFNITQSSIETNGARGVDGSLEAGGGGAGGGIMCWADTLFLHNTTLSANGGDGADAAFGGGGGGSGGRIKLFYTEVFDTTNLLGAVQGGAAGTGAYGTPESGENGTIYIDHIVGSEEIITRPVQIKILTNPTGQILKIKTTKYPLVIGIYDPAGRYIKDLYLKERVEYMRLNNLRSGVYFIRAKNENSFLAKFVIVK